MAKETETLTVKVLIQRGNESPERTKGYVVSALKSSLRNIRDGSTVMAIYGEDGAYLGGDNSGTPSEALQEEIEAVFDVETWEGDRGVSNHSP